SYPNSHYQIKPELLQIIMQNWQLNNLVSAQSDNLKLVKILKFIQPRATLGIEDMITSAKSFPEEMLSPKKINVGLPNDIYNTLV
ncbi:20903_t:CDS:2, partial [Dentiscutata erythropus]